MTETTDSSFAERNVIFTVGAPTHADLWNKPLLPLTSGEMFQRLSAMEPGQTYTIRALTREEVAALAQVHRLQGAIKQAHAKFSTARAALDACNDPAASGCSDLLVSFAKRRDELLELQDQQFRWDMRSRGARGFLGIREAQIVAEAVQSVFQFA